MILKGASTTSIYGDRTRTVDFEGSENIIWRYIKKTQELLGDEIERIMAKR